MGPPRALTIAGSDSGGGAGIVADVKTFTAHGCWALCALTAVTAQNTVGVLEQAALSPALVAAQIEAVVEDIGVDAAKTGMLATAEIVKVVAEAVRQHDLRNLVVDPVVVSKHGDVLLESEAVDALRTELVPLAALVTPNLAEAAVLAGLETVEDEQGMRRAARAIADMGAGAVLVKGGHLEGEPADLLWQGGREVWLRGARIAGRHTHGTGCVLSAAVTARLARGEGLDQAVEGGREFVRAGIGAGLALGAGVGPVNPPAQA